MHNSMPSRKAGKNPHRLHLDKWCGLKTGTGERVATLNSSQILSVRIMLLKCLLITRIVYSCPVSPRYKNECRLRLYHPCHAVAGKAPAILALRRRANMNGFARRRRPLPNLEEPTRSYAAPQPVPCSEPCHTTEENTPRVEVTVSDKRRETPSRITTGGPRKITGKPRVTLIQSVS